MDRRSEPRVKGSLARTSARLGGASERSERSGGGENSMLSSLRFVFLDEPQRVLEACVTVPITRRG